MDSLQAEMNDLKKQVKEDFQFSMITMARVTEHMNEVTKDLGHLQGKMARQEERFELMIDVMQRMMNQVTAQHQSTQQW
ncbi:hypothetical protein IV102_29390 [bacterium]|nr:hypothetical protein [bacterium]